MEKSPAPFALEQSKIKLARGDETSIASAIPFKIRQPATSIIIAHGAGGPMHSPFIRFFHTELAKQGFLTVKFNFPYMEAKKKIPDRMDVLKKSYLRIIEEARSRAHHPSKIFVGGKSMGGRVASMIAADGADVDGLFFLGYPLHSPGNFEQLRDEHLYKIAKPMLFVSGTRDTFARRDLLEKVLEKLGQKAQVYWVEGGDHSLKGHGGKDELARTYESVLASLVEWANKISLAS